jgi:hypothetical protein
MKTMTMIRTDPQMPCNEKDGHKLPGIVYCTGLPCVYKATSPPTFYNVDSDITSQKNMDMLVIVHAQHLCQTQLHGCTLPSRHPSLVLSRRVTNTHASTTCWHCYGVRPWPPALLPAKPAHLRMHQNVGHATRFLSL